MSTIAVYLLLSLSVLCTINGQGRSMLELDSSLILSTGSCIIALISLWSAGQSCLDGFPSVTDNTCTPSSSCSFQGGNGNSRQLHLFPSMRITCNGTLEGLSVAGETQTKTGNPILQIWRPTSPTSYMKISEYEFPPIGCTQPTNNVWQCTVSPSINVEEGDIIGISLPGLQKSAFGIYFTSPSSFASYILDSESVTTFSAPGSTTASVQPVLTLDIREQGIIIYW